MSKKINKNLIFLKATTIVLGIIFLVLLAVLIILKINQNKSQDKVVIDCEQNQEIVIDSEVIKVMDSRKEVILLTKAKHKKQELLTLDKKCGLLINRIQLKIK